MFLPPDAVRALRHRLVRPPGVFLRNEAAKDIKWPAVFSLTVWQNYPDFPTDALLPN